MPNQYNAANKVTVPYINARSNADTLPADKVKEVKAGEAVSNLNTRPTPGSGQFFGTDASTARAVGKGAWDGGSGSVKKVIDRIDAPFKLNTDPYLDSGV